MSDPADSSEPASDTISQSETPASVAPSRWQIYKRLLGYSKRHWPYLVMGIIGFLLYAQTQWVWAELIKYIIDAIEQSDDRARWLIGAAIIGIFFIRGVGTFMGNYGLAYVARHVIHELRSQMFERLLIVKPDALKQQTEARVLAKVTYNVEQVAAASSDALKVLLQEGFTVLMLLVYLFYSNWLLALLFISIVPAVGYVVWYASQRLGRISQRIQNSIGDVAAVVADTIKGFAAVKVYAAETYERARFLQHSTNNRQQSMKLVVTQSLNTPIVQLLVAMMLALVVWLALHPSWFGETNAAEFVAFVTAIGLLVKPVRQLTQVNSLLQPGITAAESVFETLALPVEENKGTKRLQQAPTNITFDHVSYANPDPNPDAKPLLDQIHFSAKLGQTIAIIGQSGAGKSTLIQLLLRFKAPTMGEIQVDQVALDQYELAAWRQHIAYVSQSFALFNATIRQNIAYGTLAHATDDAIWQALQYAYAKEFVQRLPQDLDTLVGEGGTTLSGGEQQRIALARAFLKRAPLLILDEATSALDGMAEQAIQQALAATAADRITFVIAHRLATIESADLILVLEGGQLVEVGTHEQLKAQQGHYERLLQSSSTRQSTASA